MADATAWLEVPFSPNIVELLSGGCQATARVAKLEGLYRTVLAEGAAGQARR